MRVTTLFSWEKQYINTVAFPTQVYKWVQANSMLGVAALWRTSISSREEGRNTPSHYPMHSSLGHHMSQSNTCDLLNTIITFLYWKPNSPKVILINDKSTLQTKQDFWLLPSCSWRIFSHSGCFWALSLAVCPHLSLMNTFAPYFNRSFKFSSLPSCEQKCKDVAWFQLLDEIFTAAPILTSILNNKKDFWLFNNTIWRVDGELQVWNP